MMSVPSVIANAGPPSRQHELIDSLVARAYRIPTDKPEADGTLAWSATTLVVVEAEAAGVTGLGYTYSDASIAALIAGHLFEAVTQVDVFDPPAAWRAMNVAVRNLGRSGLAATAISAVDTALWDLKARLLDQPLATLFGRYRESVPIYGSGGFTSYSEVELCGQLSRWIENDGCLWVKMKVGSHPDQDPQRVCAAKSAIGERSLFVDANGAYDIKQALALADRFVDDADVRWFEEPVSSDDLTGLAAIRERAPANLEIAAGEYGYDTDYFRSMISAEAIDVQQADVTRCGGYTGFLQAAALCEAYHVPLSGHCAPALHLPAACAAPRLRHLEWFHDHVRIEHLLFDGAPDPHDGVIRPDLSRPGNGLVFKFKDAERFRVA
jgi:L-alanine-DL-glutamate epimerase-like enolase superfamily enzyme